MSSGLEVPAVPFPAESSLSEQFDLNFPRPVVSVVRARRSSTASITTPRPTFVLSPQARQSGDKKRPVLRVLRALVSPVGLHFLHRYHCHGAFDDPLPTPYARH